MHAIAFALCNIIKLRQKVKEQPIAEFNNSVLSNCKAST